MATTKRARYLFRVSEGSTDVYEGDLPSTLRIRSELSIVTEHRGDCEGFDPPLDNGGFFFDLHEGISMADAESVADFLNRHVESMGTLTLGDAEDIAIEVTNSRSNLLHVEDGLTGAVEALKANLTVRNIDAAIESLKSIEGWAWRLADDWRRTIERFG